jgi:LPS sulfotransferase NodH
MPMAATHLSTSGVKIDVGAIPGILAALPWDDFVQPQFDVQAGYPTQNALVLFSTPRSGSTLLCDLLRQSQHCLPHEYFQPTDYLPVLAERWQCVRNGVLDDALYVKNLQRFRTFENGWLGLNLHGSHLKYYLRTEHHFQSVKMHYLHIQRKDILAQAVSFDIASQTRKWSSHFRQSGIAHYSRKGICEKLSIINAQNVAIRAFFLAKGLPYELIFYEDLVEKPLETLRTVPGVPPTQKLAISSNLVKQSNQQNADWACRFGLEYLDDYTAPRLAFSRRTMAKVRALIRECPW